MNTALKILGIGAALGVVLKISSAKTWDCSQLSDCARGYIGSDCIVQKAEAVQAVVDYFDELIQKSCAVEVVNLYNLQGGGGVSPP